MLCFVLFHRTTKNTQKMARIIITLTSPLFFLFFFFSFLSYQTMSQPQHMYTFCNPIENFTQTSPYESNRDILLSTLRETSSLVPYINATIGLSPNMVHGMFLCRGDINTTSCSECVQTAAIEIATNCSLNKRAVIYYDECMVRYSNVSFLSELEVRPSIVIYSLRPAPNSNRFNRTLTEKFSQLVLNISSSSPVPYFVADQERVTESEGSYDIESMVQCSPDLDLFNCTTCLRTAFFRISTCCGLPSSRSHIFTPKCLLKYKTSGFPSPPLPSPPPPLSSQPSPPPESSPPPSLSESQPPPPLLFTRTPSPSGSFSINVIKGNKIFGRIIVTMTVLVFALVDL